MLHTFQTDLSDMAWPALSATGGAGAILGRESGSSASLRPRRRLRRDTVGGQPRHVSWTRYRQPFIPRGEAGAWDWGMVYADGPILHDNQLWFFFMAGNLTHNGYNAQPWQGPYTTPNRRGKGVARLRPDGYVSVETESYAPGLLTTHRFRQEQGGQIRVNVDASAGELRYELLEDTGRPIPGCTAADCDPIRADALDGQLSWNGKPGWPPVSQDRMSLYPQLAQSEYYAKLRFYLAPGAKLYSLTIDPPDVTVWRVKLKSRLD